MLHRAGRGRQAGAVEEQPTRDEEPFANRLDHEAWAEYVARCKEMYGVTDFRAIQLRSGRASITRKKRCVPLPKSPALVKRRSRASSASSNVVRARQIAFWVLVNRRESRCRKLAGSSAIAIIPQPFMDAGESKRHWRLLHPRCPPARKVSRSFSP